MPVISTKDQSDFEGRARRKIEVRASRVSQDYTRTQLRLMEAYIFPVIGGLDLASITPEQILPLLQSIEAQHGCQQARQICGLIANVFTTGIVNGACERNPATVVRDSLSPFVRKLIPNPLTFDKFTLLVKKIGGYSASPITGAALRLSLHLLAIPGELCRAEWNDIHWDEGIWRYQLPVGVKARSGIGVHYVPLSMQAIRVFRDLQLITGTGRYVFAASRSLNNCIEPRVLLRALTRMGMGSDFTNPPAFRARARILLMETLHIPPQVVNQQLTHRIGYRKECDFNCGTCLRERRQMMQVWSDYLERLVVPSVRP
ncbi:MAG: hypothetical protein WAM85_12830 [Terracidiphilus sp.]